MPKPVAYPDVLEAHNFATTPLLKAELAAFTFPTLFLFGGSSAMCSVSGLEAFSPEFSPLVEIQCLAGAGHLMPLEVPAQVFQRISRWIEGA